MNTVEQSPMYEWNTIAWRKVQRNVFKLQKRIYQASSRGDVKTVHKLQRLLIKSRSAKLIAVRKVTQDNQGKKTAGIDGVKSLNPEERLELSNKLRIESKPKAKPVRRVWIPKSGSDEKRPLGIPTISERASQTLVKMALEPEWEAQFEPNSYGFRPGRSTQDAIRAIHTAINHKAKYALDADIAKCFDKIEHKALLNKLNTSPKIRKQIKVWLKAGVMDEGQLFPTQEGTMQGGPLSPLLANIALHGMENTIKAKFPRKKHLAFSSPQVIRYADDIVVLHAEEQVIKQCKEILEETLKEMGLELKPGKTKIVHTLEQVDGQIGFNFLGFEIRQYKVGNNKSDKNRWGKVIGFKTLIKPSKQAINKQLEKIREIINHNQYSTQKQLIEELNPVIRGWSRYYSSGVSKKVFQKLDSNLFWMLFAWAKKRHSNKAKKWVAAKYWKFTKATRWEFQTVKGEIKLHKHTETPIRRHVKVQAKRSPFDGDWVYWSSRMGHHPEVSSKVAYLLKRQKGRCLECGLFFNYGDILEVDHIIPKRWGGTDAKINLQLLHRHCHDVKTARNSSVLA